MTSLRQAPNDRVLPHLARALDATVMAGLFQHHIDARARRSAHVQSCAIERIKYRPGRNCVLGYRVRMIDARRGAFDHRLYVGLYPAADARARFDRAQQEANAPCEFLPAISLIEPFDMIVRSFPNDPKLHALPHLVDHANMRHALGETLGLGDCGERTAIADGPFEVITYFPEHSCTFAIDRTLRRAGTTTIDRVYAKTRHDDAGAATFDVMHQLWHSSARREGRVGYARPLGYNASLRLLWQDGIDAVPLSRLLDGAADLATWRRVGTAVAALHDTLASTRREQTMAQLLVELNETADLVARVVPELAARAMQLLDALNERASGFDFQLDATLHGDLHSNNILMDAQRVYLIDLERVTRGAGLVELSSLLAEAAYRACLLGQTVDWPAAQTLISAYEHARGLRLNRDEVCWHLSASLLRERVRRCITSLKPSWLVILPRLLAIARAILEDSAVLHQLRQRTTI